MKWAIYLLFMSVICLMFWLWQTDNHVSETAFLRLKNANEVATHDAALQIDKVELGNGIIRFASHARTEYEASLRRNLRLNGSNLPIQPNMFPSTDALEVLVFEEVETGCPGKPAGFPCIFDAYYGAYGYIDTLYGPSIVAIIRMRHPRPFGISDDVRFVVGAAHEYKS